MELVAHESKFDKYIALAYYLATCVIGPMRPVILLNDLLVSYVKTYRVYIIMILMIIFPEIRCYRKTSYICRTTRETIIATSNLLCNE